MAKFLFLETEKTGKFVKAKVKDGFVTIGTNSFYVDEDSAIYVKTLGGYEPFYILKWDAIYPAKIKTEVSDKLVGVERSKTTNGKEIVVNKYERAVVTQLIVERDRRQTPESLYKSLKVKILGGMLRVSKPISGIVPLLLGLIIGMGLAILFVYLKIIPVG